MTGLPQNGVTDKDGILRFLPEDIKEEVYRVAETELDCIFCKETGAYIGCNIKECRNIWHFACGADNGINHQFFGKYKAFCKQHCNLPRKIQQRANQDIKNRSCPICLCIFEPGDIPLFGSCCATSIFHRRCIQEYALSSGSLFKCPTCSKRTFKRDCEWQGVYVPEQDAAWEKEPNAFRDLLRRPLHCDFVPCQCPQGKNFRDIETKGEWYIVRCVLCGGTSTHAKCSQVTNITSWTCDVCTPLADDADSDSLSEKSNYSSDSDDDLFVAIPRKVPKTEDSPNLFKGIPDAFITVHVHNYMYIGLLLGILPYLLELNKSPYEVRRKPVIMIHSFAYIRFRKPQGNETYNIIVNANSIPRCAFSRPYPTLP
ncbi:PHD finger protein 7 [Orchesella cincta]|uniref:PHD finger protein 7 n=1 Tax=Orchesella cincta TaxID=48709 RepID=A0A1D2MZA2_ORCCI|nr:PHD finger protein 7 [Orchesella cincta]